ncbi:hypothetical protein SAMN05421771_4063 [Granulicella pectinivorans]|jgi:hypothetical protein|uniref:Uncharacterized protein n=1 Tax=Granulicella pectinivorans TaxID=474950 RepID=A0A1I6MZL7_9BACT|nr:hypothetical protein [Granulicella pectinivorans]SFS21155.1 hypothetical protein SAMN05421771_4063 [Granulicella pectinivorans]
MSESEQKHPAGAPGVWKHPNFKAIVIGSAVFVLVLLGASLLLVRTEGGHLVMRTKVTHASQN